MTVTVTINEDHAAKPFQVVVVADAADPSPELSALKPSYLGQPIIVTSPGTRSYTLYVADNNGFASDGPYAVAVGDGPYAWLAIAGTYSVLQANFRDVVRGQNLAFSSYISGSMVQSAGVQVGVCEKRDDYLANAQDYEINVDASAKPVSIELPAVIQFGTRFLIRKIDASANPVTVVATVDGVVNPTITAQYGRRHVVSNLRTYYSVG